MAAKSYGSPKGGRFGYPCDGSPKFMDPRTGPSPIGPGPVVPKGAPPPSSKGSISYPEPAVGGK